MTNESPAGFWKGLAITRTYRVLVVAYLERDGNALRGKFEAPELYGEDSRGDLIGEIQNDTITLESTNHDISFTGQIIGEEPDRQIIYGVIRLGEESEPTGTVTLFHGDLHGKPVFTLYKGG
jgi:hypothetical protein